MRPVLEGMCQMESLHNCSLGLEDFALMNDALDAKTENMKRARAAEKER